MMFGLIDAVIADIFYSKVGEAVHDIESLFFFNPFYAAHT